VCFFVRYGHRPEAGAVEQFEKTTGMAADLKCHDPSSLMRAKPDLAHAFWVC
jgi:hypothetical protein